MELAFFKLRYIVVSTAVSTVTVWFHCPDSYEHTGSFTTIAFALSVQM